MKRIPTKHARLIPETNGAGYPFASGIFGVNAEITRRAFWSGLSAQMLNNRKLYMGKDGVDGWDCIGFERITNRPCESLCESNFVILRNGSMTQSSEVIALREGAVYEAKVWAKAVSDTASVTFGVAGMEQTVEIVADGMPYQELSFTFEGVDLTQGSFSVSVVGDAAVYEVSLMPAENFYGMRIDVIEKLRQIAPTSIRFPGGCAADHFDWKESLKAPEFRKPMDGTSKAKFLLRDSYHQDPLDIGLNEFICLCRELGAEPEYTVSLILSDGEDARRLVEYCNGAADTEYGARRQALGYDPFHIHLWFVGNEAYSFGGAFKESVAAAKRTDELVAAMRQADDSIAVAICMAWGWRFSDWARAFRNALTCDFAYVSYHDYIGMWPNASKGIREMATCEALEEYFADGGCDGLNFYRDDLYAESFDAIHICVDEWNYDWGRGSSNALFFSNALQFHFLAKSKETYHVDRAEFFLPVNEGMITVRGNLCQMESTGELFCLMAPHKGGRVIACRSDSDDLDVLCTDHGDTLYLSVINRKVEKVSLSIDGYTALELCEIHTGEYSFENNDFAIEHPRKAAVHGHSVLFCTLKKEE